MYFSLLFALADLFKFDKSLAWTRNADKLPNLTTFSGRGFACKHFVTNPELQIRNRGYFAGIQITGLRPFFLSRF